MMADSRKPASNNSVPMAIVFGAVVVAGALALTRKSDPPLKRETPVSEAPVAAPQSPADPADNPNLPAGHPAIGAGGGPGVASVHGGMAGAPGMGMGGAGMGMEAAPPSVTWTVPKRWELVPHESAMRIATYRIPRAPGDAEDAELSVIRAGGDTESNIDRWLGQFDEAGRKSAKRSEKTVGGLKVWVVEIHGAYSGMGSPEPQQGFAMLSAIVDTPDTKHFFKMTGPAKTVDAARAEFDSLVDSIVPATH
jgi:hypothetical protein